MSSSLLNTEALREAAAQSNTMISLCKRYLGELQDELRARFYADEPIQTLVRMRSEKLDILLRFLWSRYDWGDDIALIAVGGYGLSLIHI